MKDSPVKTTEDQVQLKATLNHNDKSKPTLHVSVHHIRTFILFGFPSERVDKVKIRVKEASWIFQLWVVTDMFVQNGDC